MFTLTWGDAEIGSRLYMQAMFLNFVEVLGPRGEKAMGSCLHSVMHKLTAMKYHITAYAEFEETLRAQYTASFQVSPSQNAESFDLICHFEAFMFQLKSALDMLVKLFRYVPVTEKVYVATYTKSGVSLINELRSLAAGRLKKDPADRVAERLGALAQLAERAKAEWLEDAVHLRGVLIHDRGAKDFTFTPRIVNGAVEAQAPLYRDEPVLARMNWLYSRVLEYAQDFMAHTLAIAFPVVRLAPASAVLLAAFSPQGTEFIKWGWEMNGETVTGIFHTAD